MRGGEAGGSVGVNRFFIRQGDFVAPLKPSPWGKVAPKGPDEGADFGHLVGRDDLGAPFRQFFAGDFAACGRRPTLPMAAK